MAEMHLIFKVKAVYDIMHINLTGNFIFMDIPYSYEGINNALKTGGGFGGTIEFFPEEGKYHYDGHRNCGVCFKPSDTRAALGICPVCGGRITAGVLSRVEELGDRAAGFIPQKAPHYEHLIPLREVIASSMGLTTASKKAEDEYNSLLRNLGPELYILREAPAGDIEHTAGALIAEGIRRLRSGSVDIRPGCDGEYGKIKIL
jgi:PHP family Zn ribbon phosphoesterase